MPDVPTHIQPSESFYLTVRESVDGLDLNSDPVAAIVFPALEDGHAAGEANAQAQAAEEIQLDFARIDIIPSAESLDFARLFGSREITVIESSTKDAIAEIVSQGLSNFRGVPGTGRDLREALLADQMSQQQGRMAGLNRNNVRSVLKLERELRAAGFGAEDIARMSEREIAKQRRRRAELIANNEMNVALSEGEKSQMLALGAKEKTWQTAGDDRVSPGCAENEAAGWIRSARSFPSGHSTTPRFPRCRCAVTYRGVDPRLVRDRIAA